MLIGEYYHNIDAKGRIIVPARFRDCLGDSFVVAKDLDRCLSLYSTAEWENFQKELLSKNKAENRRVNRFFFSGAFPCETDTQGRILIPPTFREYASLVKEAAIIGVSTHVEIWSGERWKEYSQDPQNDADVIASEMESRGL